MSTKTIIRKIIELKEWYLNNYDTSNKFKYETKNEIRALKESLNYEEAFIRMLDDIYDYGIYPEKSKYELRYMYLYGGQENENE